MSTVGFEFACKWMSSSRKYVVVRILLRPCHCSSVRKTLTLSALQKLYRKPVASWKHPMYSSKCRRNRCMIISGGTNAMSVSTSKQKVMIVSNNWLPAELMDAEDNPWDRRLRGACHRPPRRAPRRTGRRLTDEWLASDGSRVHADEIVLGLNYSIVRHAHMDYEVW